MVDREFDDLLTPEERLVHERIRAILELGKLVGVLGGDNEAAQVLAERLRVSSEAEVVQFRKSAGEILKLVGVDAPVSDVESQISGMPLAAITESTESIDKSVSDNRGQQEEPEEFEGGPWLQRVTTAELDRIDSTDQAVCHIREAVSEIIELLGVDPEYINIDLCMGMLERIWEKEVTAFEVTDDYLERLVRTSLDYHKTVPMSSQIVNSICFWASLKGIPFTALLPYRELTWPPDRYQGPSQGNVTSSRYFVEGYVKSARYDAAQLASRLARQAERERVDKAISEIAEGLQNDSGTDTTT